MEENYDIVIVGSGPGGYTAAVRAANEGARVALIEKEDIGGLCLNWGCIPSKILLKHAQTIAHARGLANSNIVSGELNINFSELIAHSRKRVETIRESLSGLIEASGVKIIKGTASLQKDATIEVRSAAQTMTLQAKRGVLIATGARARNLKDCPADGEYVITSREALALQKLPASLAIVGGGVIGCEMATFFAALGTKVAILEMMPQLIPGLDTDIAKALLRSLKKRGIDVRTNTSVKLENISPLPTLTLNDGKDTAVSADYILVAAGIVPASEFANDLVECERGFILVNSQTYMTSMQNVYAVGDVIQLRGGPTHHALAHVASAEAERAVEHMLHGKINSSIDYENIPFAIFTEPEIGSVGLSEDAAHKKYPDHEIFAQTVSDKVMGIAIALGQTEGMTKLIIDKTRYNMLLGAHIMGNAATERIHVLVEARRAEDTAHLMANQMLAHPTFSETIRETLLAYDGRAVHVPIKMQRRKK